MNVDEREIPTIEELIAKDEEYRSKFATHEELMATNPRYKADYEYLKKLRRKEIFKAIIELWLLPIQGILAILIIIFPYIIAILSVWLLLQ